MKMMERLRTARPHLIFRLGRVADSQPTSGCMMMRVEPSIRNNEPSHVVLDEGYDPHGSPLNRPVYWRIVTRTDGKFYLSTFLLERELVTKAWGSDGAAYCDPVTGIAFAGIETSFENMP
jgi:hypothetical protein